MAVIKVRQSDGSYKSIKTIKGKSAYELAVANGFVGTEQEWLESLKGDAGTDVNNTQYNTLETNDKTLVGSINELKDAIDNIDVSSAITTDTYDSLTTSDKTITGSINELNSNKFDDVNLKNNKTLEFKANGSVVKSKDLDLTDSVINVADTNSHFTAKDGKKLLPDVLDQLFQFADNGKKSIASTIGNPLSANDTFTQMDTKIGTIKTNLKDNLTDKNVELLGTETMSELVDKVGEISNKLTKSNNISSNWTIGAQRDDLINVDDVSVLKCCDQIFILPLRYRYNNAGTIKTEYFTNCIVYDIETDSYIEKKDRLGASYVISDGRYIYLFNDPDVNNIINTYKIYRYDPQTEESLKLGVSVTMPTNYSSKSIVNVNNQDIYIYNCSSSFIRYSIELNTITTLSVSCNSYCSSCYYLGDYIYILGSLHYGSSTGTDNHAYPYAYKYNILTQAMTKITDMPNGKYDFNIIPNKDNTKLYTLFGKYYLYHCTSFMSSQFPNPLESFDIETETWTTHNPIAPIKNVRGQGIVELDGILYLYITQLDFDRMGINYGVPDDICNVSGIYLKQY